MKFRLMVAALLFAGLALGTNEAQAHERRPVKAVARGIGKAAAKVAWRVTHPFGGRLRQGCDCN